MIDFKKLKNYYIIAYDEFDTKLFKGTIQNVIDNILEKEAKNA